MKRTPRQEVRDRAIKTYRYLIRGITASEIAKIEQIPLRTVYWLIHEGGRLLGGELKTLAETGLLRELVLHHQERKKELWMLFSTTRQDRVKIACLAQLAEEDVHLLNLAERWGSSVRKGSRLMARQAGATWCDGPRRIARRASTSINQRIDRQFTHSWKLLNQRAPRPINRSTIFPLRLLSRSRNTDKGTVCMNFLRFILADTS